MSHAIHVVLYVCIMQFFKLNTFFQPNHSPCFSMCQLFHAQSVGSEFTIRARSDALVLFTLAKQRARNVQRERGERCGMGSWISLFMQTQLTIQFIRLVHGCASPRFGFRLYANKTRWKVQGRIQWAAADFAMGMRMKQTKKNIKKQNETVQSKFDCALFLQTSKHKLSAYFPAPPRWPFKAQLSFMANLWAA